MCKLMKVSRSAYYEWLSAPESIRVKKDADLAELIKDIFKEGRGTYGARRIKKRLLQKNIVVSRCRITRLMQESGLVCKTKCKFKATTDSSHNKHVAPNLLARQFYVNEANRYWVGDISVPCKAA